MIWYHRIFDQSDGAKIWVAQKVPAPHNAADRPGSDPSLPYFPPAPDPRHPPPNTMSSSSQSFKYTDMVQRNQSEDLPRFETVKVTFDPSDDLHRISLSSPDKTKKKPKQKGTPHPKKVKKSFKPQREPVVDNLTVRRLRRGKMSEMEPLVKVSFDIKLEDVLIDSDTDSDSDLYHSVLAKKSKKKV